jgi:hypothetical protein
MDAGFILLELTLPFQDLNLLKYLSISVCDLKEHYFVIDCTHTPGPDLKHMPKVNGFVLCSV